MATVIIAFKRLSFKFFDLVLGGTPIFAIVFGWYLILTGVFSLVKPEKARARIVISGFSLAQIYLLILCFLLWGIGTQWSQFLSGRLQTIVFLGGFFGSIALFFWARAAVRKFLASWSNRLPIPWLTRFAWGQIVAGGLLVYFRHKLW